MVRIYTVCIDGSPVIATARLEDADRIRDRLTKVMTVDITVDETPLVTDEKFAQLTDYPTACECSADELLGGGQ